MNVNLQVRLKQIESLENYISSSRDKIQSILDCLKWNEKELFEDKQLITCSVNPSHRVHIKGVEDHIQKCSLRSEGYSLNEEFLSEPLHDLNSSILIDDHKKIEIIYASRKNISDYKTVWNGQDPNPKTADRLTSTYSSDERLSVYSYAVANTIGPPNLPEFTTLSQDTEKAKSSTYAELRTLERDSKRRRIKYKSVYTNHKNHIEVMREVIEGQMDAYKEWLIRKNGIEEPNKTFENGQSSTEQTITDCERSESVVSKKSLQSSSSKNSAIKVNHSRNRHHSHSRKYDYKDRRSEHRRYRSKDHHDRKYNRSKSRHSYSRQNSNDSIKDKEKSSSKDY